MKIKNMIDIEENYTFPQFILSIRRCLGTSRRMACDDMGMLHHRLFALEHGNFSYFPKELPSIAEYYTIPKALLTKKVKLFLREKKNKVHDFAGSNDEENEAV